MAIGGVLRQDRYEIPGFDVWIGIEAWQARDTKPGQRAGKPQVGIHGRQADLPDQSLALDHQTFLALHRAGVPILASTDASFANPYLFHGYSLLDELDLYVEIGLTPREALHAATLAPAAFLGFPDQDGRIAEGRRADLVLLDDNPLVSLDTLRRPAGVIANGRFYDRAALNAMEAALIER